MHFAWYIINIWPSFWFNWPSLIGLSIQYIGQKRGIIFYALDERENFNSLQRLELNKRLRVVDWKWYVVVWIFQIKLIQNYYDIIEIFDFDSNH